MAWGQLFMRSTDVSRTERSNDLADKLSNSNPPEYNMT